MLGTFLAFRSPSACISTRAWAREKTVRGLRWMRLPTGITLSSVLRRVEASRAKKKESQKKGKKKKREKKNEKKIENVVVLLLLPLLLLLLLLLLI